jgi:predicted DNA repair protein MutK
MRRERLGALKAGIAGILAAAPKMMRSLSVIGTIAMFMVGGGILTTACPSRITPSRRQRKP